MKPSPDRPPDLLILDLSRWAALPRCSGPPRPSTARFRVGEGLKSALN